MSAKAPTFCSQVTLRNFRGFQYARDIPLAPLTFLVGPNSSGKSSFSNALLLLAQSQFGFYPSLSFVPEWGGPLIDLGSYPDTVFGQNVNRRITIEMEFRNLRSWGMAKPMPPLSVSHELRCRSDDPVGQLSLSTLVDRSSNEAVTLRFRHARSKSVLVGVLDSEFKVPLGPRGHFQDLWEVRRAIQKAIKNTPKSRLRGKKAGLARILNVLGNAALYPFLGGTERVASGREGPKRWYSRTVQPRDAFGYGPAGAMTVYDRVHPTALGGASVGRSGKRARASQGSVNRELGQVLKRLDIANQIGDSALSPYHSVVQLVDNLLGLKVNLADVGFGASQVLPVLRACLSEARGPLIIEQPEIHLHPKAQGTVAELIIETSKRRQVIVETHSVHLINRARMWVAGGKLPMDHVMVIYVNRDKWGSHALPIPLKETGDFSEEWPGGFFDERYEDTMALLKLKSKRQGAR